MTDQEERNWQIGNDISGGRLSITRKVAFALGAKDAEIERLRTLPEQLVSMIEDYSPGQIRMAAGEMTAQEMQAVQAVQRWFVSALRHRTTQLLGSPIKEEKP